MYVAKWLLPRQSSIVYVPFESSLTILQKTLAVHLYNHHNSNEMPKVYIASTIIETRMILQCLSSSRSAYIENNITKLAITIYFSEDYVCIYMYVAV